ncbi:MAG: hypothetical protein J6E46_13480 [Faecalicoccus sp.]|nr:hypothetical protein [Faecalicoccus sp.]
MGRNEYIDYIDFFMKIKSDDLDVESLLRKHQNRLKKMDLHSMSDKTLANAADPYVLFYEAYYEKDPKKKFIKIYRMSNFFEPEIAYALNSGTLFINDNELEELLMASENLHIYESDNAKKKFNTKEFVEYMESSGTLAKIVCLFHAVDAIGQMPKRSSGTQYATKEDVVKVSKELYELGYLTKYEIDDLGYLYTISNRGAKIFTNKTSRSFLSGYINGKLPVNDSDSINGYNAVKLRIQMMDAMDEIKHLKNGVSFEAQGIHMSNNTFRIEYEGTDTQIILAGILSDDPECFERFKNLLEDSYFNHDYIVIYGYSNQYVQALSKWLISHCDLNIENKLCTMVHQDLTIYSWQTGEPLELDGEDVQDHKHLNELLDDIRLKDILVEEDFSSLSYSESKKAKYNYESRKFIKDISGMNGSSMTYSLMRMGESGYFKASHMDVLDEKEYRPLVQAAQKLYDLGYYGKYTIQNMDSFYVLTKRGIKAYTTGDASSMIRAFSYDDTGLKDPEIMEIDHANEAKLILLKEEAIDKTGLIAEKGEYYAHDGIISDRFYILDFLEGKAGDLYHIGMTLDDKEHFIFFKEQLLEKMKESKKIGYLIVSGLTEDQAKALANIVLEYFELPLEKEKIYYTVYGEKGIYNLMTGEELKKC